jgi:hypothetical protein
MMARTSIRIALAIAALLALLVQPLTARADRPQDGRVYVTMDDGVEIAVYLEFPAGWDGSTKLPAILQYDGYEGGGGPSWYSWPGMRDAYVLAHAGVRGAGCSGGQWSFFSERQARDGAAVVEWLAVQEWANGDVGIQGHSYPGYMGLFVAAQRPPHLRAISVSGTGDDPYRDVVFPGGIPSRLFAPLWLGFARPSSSEGAAVDNAVQNGQTDCAEHTFTRAPENPTEHSFVMAVGQDQDSDFWYTHAPKSVVDRITVPTQIHAQSNDEQILQSTRGSSILFQSLRMSDKQLIITNGDHNAWELPGQPAIEQARIDWLDRHVRGIPNGIDAQPKVRVLLESHFGAGGKISSTGEVGSDAWPLSQTTWTRLFAGPGNTLTTTKPAAEGADAVLLGTHRQLTDPTLSDYANGYSTGQEYFWADGPDSVVYTTEPASTTQVAAGPLAATIYARILAPDADVYVSVQDEAPDGSRSLVTRGYLRASHRALDLAGSGRDGDVVYRPHHPHTNPQPLPVGEVVRLDLEIVPAGLVIRPGHSLRFVITSPPQVQTYGVFQPTTPAPAQILYGGEHATSLLLPLVNVPASLGPEPACGTQVAVFCAKPAL